MRWLNTWCVVALFSASSAAASVSDVNGRDVFPRTHFLTSRTKPRWRDSACACVHKHTKADARFQLRNGLFHSSVGKSLIAVWLTSVLMWRDTALWEQVRGKASFFFSPSLFMCGSILPRGDAKSLAWSFCLPLTSADVTAGSLNGQQDKSFIWRSSSPPPLSAFPVVPLKAC